jgi:hypothetical protein
VSIRSWIDGLARLDVEHLDGRVRIGLHGVNERGEVIEYGFVGSFNHAAREEIAQFIKEGL